MQAEMPRMQEMPVQENEARQEMQVQGEAKWNGLQSRDMPGRELRRRRDDSAARLSAALPRLPGV
jgi:hypothetical protein